MTFRRATCHKKLFRRSTSNMNFFLSFKNQLVYLHLVLPLPLSGIQWCKSARFTRISFSHFKLIFIVPPHRSNVLWKCSCIFTWCSLGHIASVWTSSLKGVHKILIHHFPLVLHRNVCHNLFQIYPFISTMWTWHHPRLQHDIFQSSK